MNTAKLSVFPLLHYLSLTLFKLTRRAGGKRGEVKDEIRTVIENDHDYGLIKHVKSEEDAKSNRRRVKKLGPINFYCAVSIILYLHVVRCLTLFFAYRTPRPERALTSTQR